MESSVTKTARRKSPALAVFDFLASLKLATVLLLLLFVLTWLATLEQTVNGLRPMMLKYFNWKELFFFPEIGRPFNNTGEEQKVTVFFPMISGFWLCALFTLNLTLGGLVRIRKTARVVPVIVSHFSIVFLMVAAGVTHFMEERGALMVYEGETSNVAQDYHEQVIEVSEFANGAVSKVHLIEGKPLTSLKPDETRIFKMANLPFDLKVSNFIENAQPMPAMMQPPTQGQEVVDRFWLRDSGPMKETELHQAGCFVEVLSKEGQPVGEKIILASRSNYPATVSYEGRPYLINLRKKLWVLPFAVQLDEFRVERDPGTNRPATFESDVTRLDGGTREEVHIKMNEPMRREGYTFFQTNWGPQDEENPDRYYSVLEVVKNPADHWPLASLIVVMAGLCWQFGASLFRFMSKSKKEATS
ncbi:MAG: cytochrome c biogenesis protein ResB [Verrucomicrobiota bacterium JB023]|nr:cytochrome c biogenesis protein ResB [Verrucomicrobiota bacterium JB023]